MPSGTGKEILTFTIDGSSYLICTDTDKEQRYSKNAFNSLSVLLIRRHAATEEREATPALTVKDQLRSVQGWLIQEARSKVVTGVIIDNEQAIHIKPKQSVDPQSRPADLVAFVAQSTIDSEFGCTLPMERENRPEEDVLCSIEEADYLKEAEEYFEIEEKSRDKNQSAGLLAKIKWCIPKEIRRIIFWWDPVVVEAAATPWTIGEEYRRNLAREDKKRKLLAAERGRSKGTWAEDKKWQELTAKDSSRRPTGEAKKSIPQERLPGDRVPRPAGSSEIFGAKGKKCGIVSLIGKRVCGHPSSTASPEVPIDDALLGDGELLVFEDDIEELGGPTGKMGKRSKRIGNKERAGVSPPRRSSGDRGVKRGKKSFLGIPFYKKLREVDDKIAAPISRAFPIERRAIAIAVALDSLFIEKIGSKKSAIFFVLETINIASRIYEKSFNLVLYVSDVIIDESAKWYGRKCSIKEKLDDFTQYRKTKSKSCLVYHLFTGIEPQKEIGLAWVGHFGPKSLSNVGVSVLVQNQFITVAHEIAHNLGLVHDCDHMLCKDCTPTYYICHPCDGCDCDGKYIMNRKGTLGMIEFSPSSKREMSTILSSLENYLPLVDEVKMPYPVCGNGIVEKGEECDAGPFGDECCTPDCKLRVGALCSDSNSPCCRGCVPAPAGAVCRESQDECQKDSVCDGISDMCPRARFMPNRKRCSLGFCASGTCTNRDAQCVLAGDRNGLVGSHPTHKGCQMRCVNVEGSVVLLRSRFFKNGTPCGWNGVCANGKCEKDLRVAALCLAALLVGMGLISILLLA